MTPDSAIRARNHAPLVGIGLMAFLLIGAEQALLGPLLPKLQDRFGIGPGAGGWFFSLHAIGAALVVAASLLPPLERRMRYRPSLSLICLALGAGLVSIGDAWAIMLIGAFALGVGFGGLTLGLNALFHSRFDSTRPAMLNLLNAAFGAGAVLGPLALVRVENSPTVFAFLAVAALCLALPALWLDDRMRAQNLVDLKPVTSVSFRRPGLILSAVFFALGFEASLVAWGASLLIARGMSGDDATALVSGFFFCFLLVRLGGVVLSLRISASNLSLLGLIIAASALASLQFHSSDPAAFLIAGGATGLVFPNLFATAASRLQTWPRAPSFIILVALAGAASLPAIMGLLAAGFGEKSLALPIAATGLAAAICLSFAMYQASNSNKLARETADVQDN